jgi:hypothetical protein
MSRFVSAGSTDDPSEHDEAWLKAHEAIEATGKKKTEIGQQEGGKSLYETLQANKGDFADTIQAITVVTDDSGEM